ncbi:sll1863 family stress response protein [Methylomonas albis]|uniref:Coiled coil domain-containing protein n=1 Tax=Methylomonas albis TaxID=1854563 RepID=A0ABR9D058_9GAMM|nr:coiled coil domain-containing protein [Methylomonas albis]MBD9356510.1 coiled coil domain-containing protein [Methylomonas albis]
MNTKKEAYQEKFEAQLREWAAEIEVLKAKADTATAEAKIVYFGQIEELHAKQTAAQTKLQELRASGEQAWEALKPGLEHAWHDLRTAIDDAVSKIK